MGKKGVTGCRKKEGNITHVLMNLTETTTLGLPLNCINFNCSLSQIIHFCPKRWEVNSFKLDALFEFQINYGFQMNLMRTY